MPCDSSSPPRPAMIEDSITFEDHETRGRSSSEVLVDTIILSLNSISSKAGENITNDLIAVLRDNEFPIDLFRERVKNVSQIKRVSKSILQRQKAHCGFLKMELNDESGTFTGILHYLDAVEVLKKQLRLSNHSNTNFIPQFRGNAEGSRFYDHPMSTEFAHNVYNDIREKVLYEYPDGKWFDYYSGGQAKIFSLVAFIQLFTDKTHTTLKASSVAAYPVHLTLQNYSDSFRRIEINSGLSIIGYLPVDTIEMEDPEDEVHVPHTSMTDGRTKRMEILHSAMKVILSTLEESVEKGFEATTADGFTIRCHPALTSYVTDLPEVNDMTATKSGQTARPCHRCMIPLNEMPYTHEHLRRTIESLRMARKSSFELKDEAAREQDRIKARELKDAANNVLKADSIAEYTGFLESSPLVEYLHGEYTMDIFAFEPLHNLHLGISKQLKRCIYDRMLHNRHRTIILNACNDLLRRSFAIPTRTSKIWSNRRRTSTYVQNMNVHECKRSCKFKIWSKMLERNWCQRMFGPKNCKILEILTRTSSA